MMALVIDFLALTFVVVTSSSCGVLRTNKHVATCFNCQQSFESNNKLHRHLRAFTQPLQHQNHQRRFLKMGHPLREEMRQERKRRREQRRIHEVWKGFNP